MLELVANDLRLAARRVLHDPLFSTIAVLTLAIGIGANSAIFTLVNGVLLRPLPFAEPDRLVHVQAVIDGEGTDLYSAGGFRALHEHATVFSGVALVTGGSGTLTGVGEPEVLSGKAISANFFDVVGVRPLHGRLFREGENEPGQHRVVLLSETLWRERFGGDPAVVGRTITINDIAREVVGVMPARASFPDPVQYWVPLQYSDQFKDPNNLYALYLQVIARLQPGVTLAAARADAVRVMELAKQQTRRPQPNWTADVESLHEYYVGASRRPLLVLLGAVGLVLLIACANLANLLLAQAASRATDFAVQRALGASPLRLVRQLLVESMVLATAGGAAGLLLGAWAADALLGMLPPELPRMPGIGLDATVVGFTIAASVGAALLFGLAPALQARRAALAPALRQGGRGLAGRAGARTRSALVLIETALAFALVISAGLLIRSFDQLRRVDPGFRAENRLTFDLLLPSARYDSEPRLASFWDELLDRLEAVPGVQAAGAMMELPLGGGGTHITFVVEGRPELPPGQLQAMDVRVVTPGFFDAMGVPLRRGRLFTDDDRTDAPRVALLSEAAAARHFPNEDPIGKRIIMGWTPRDTVRVHGEVVGIVGDVRHGTLRETAQPEIYFPLAQVPRNAMTITLAADRNPLALQQAVKAAVAEIDPALAPARMRPMHDVVAASMATDRFMTRLLSAFSAMALLLAAIGIFGVISYGVTQRRRELGVRMAIGATRRDVVHLVVGGAVRLAGGGVIAGFLAALAVTRLLRSMLYGVGTYDVLTFLTGGAVLLSVALVASMLPAWRAARTPPASVLNTD